MDVKGDNFSIYRILKTSTPHSLNLVLKNTCWKISINPVALPVNPSKVVFNQSIS